jgi:hypothetical protein
MEHEFSWILAWQSAVPIVAGILGVMLPGWLSNRWHRAAVAKSARVSSEIDARERRAQWSESKAIAPR